MSEREGAQDVEELRRGLHALVEDVEPRGDALARVLSARQRRSRRAPRRPLLAAGGLAVAAAAAVVVALVPAQQGQPQRAEPVSVAPNSYVAATGSSVAAFDVLSGQRVRELGELGGPVRGALVADGQQVYARVAAGGGEDVVRISPDGELARVRHLAAPSPVLAAAGGNVAVLEPSGVVISGAGPERRIAVPAGMQVLDLALAPDGRVAVLTAEAGGNRIRVVPPGAAALDQPPMPVVGVCGPLAIDFSGADLATLSPLCGGGADGRVRISTLDGATGQPLGAGVPFAAGGPADAQRVQLSADRLGRFLVSAGTGQWLVDEAVVRQVPPACATTCATTPATFWG